MKDPVCGMEVAPAKAAAHIEHAGTTYYFCSSGCAAKFRADPMRYAGPETATPPSAPTTAAPELGQTLSSQRIP